MHIKWIGSWWVLNQILPPRKGDLCNNNNNKKVEHLPIMDWLAFPQNLHVEVLTPRNMTEFGDKAFTEITEIKWGHKSEALIYYSGLLIKETPGMLQHKQMTVWGHSKRWPSANHTERPQKKQNLLSLWSWTASLQNCEKLPVTKPPQSVAFWNGSPDRLIHFHSRIFNLVTGIVTIRFKITFSNYFKFNTVLT